MKKIAVFLNGEKSCFMTSFNDKKTKEVYYLTHIELLQSIFCGGTADLWILVKKPQITLLENIEYEQAFKALKMTNKNVVTANILNQPKNKVEKIKVLHEILNTTIN